jgi:zinc D-Ala-D-Ala carboxypeptidase
MQSTRRPPLWIRRLVAVGVIAAVAAIAVGFGLALRGAGLPTFATSHSSDDSEQLEATEPAHDNQNTSPNDQADVTPTESNDDTQLDESDGYIGDNVITAFDDDHPAIAKMDSDLLDALRAATADAADDDIVMTVNSGWRSTAYQDYLFNEAVVTYGSVEEASRWVNTPDRSTHVSGDAVDVGPTDAAYWMNQYGANYGLCQTYANEIWHYELLTEPGGTCPAPLADATS